MEVLYMLTKFQLWQVAVIESRNEMSSRILLEYVFVC